MRAHDQTELLAAVHVLAQRIKMNPKIKLVIIDSIAFHFRQEDKGNIRARQLANITQTLNSICFNPGIACVVTNHMTTQVDKVRFLYLFPSVPIYMHTYIHTYIHTHIRTYIRTYTYDQLIQLTYSCGV